MTPGHTRAARNEPPDGAFDCDARTLYNLSKPW